MIVVSDAQADSRPLSPSLPLTLKKLATALGVDVTNLISPVRGD